MEVRQYDVKVRSGEERELGRVTRGEERRGKGRRKSDKRRVTYKE